MTYNELVDLVYDFGSTYKYSIMMSDDDNILIETTDFPRALFELGYYFSCRGLSLDASRQLHTDVSVNGGVIYLKIFKF